MAKEFVCFLFTILWSYVLSESCRTPLGVTSNCVSLYDCKELVAAFEQRPLPSHVVNFLRQSQCGFEGYVPRVCCGPLPSQQQPTQTTTPSRPTRPAVVADGRIDPTYDEDSYPASENKCGVDTNGDKVYGGQFTELDEFPWMALLGYRTRSGSITYQCGGVLVNKRYVVTAAHCITGAVEREVGILTTVRLGEYDTQNEIDCVANLCADRPQDIPVLTAVPHPGYSDRNKNRKDDVGVIRLAKRVNYSYYVKPICLSTDSNSLSVGNDVFVAGWGKTLNGRNSPIKLKLRLPIFSKSECAEKYRTLGAELTEKQICAGGVFAEDACRGDSGGPLMKLRPDGVWESVAVVSFGFGCGRDGWPGVYSSIAAYSRWIRTTIQSTNV